MEKISLSSIAEALAAKGGITREAASNFMHAFIKTIEKGLQENGMVKVKGLGTFKLLEVSDRSSVDVNTGERIIIKGYRKVTFTPDSAMKEFVNRPFAHFEPTELNDGYPEDEEPIMDDNCSDDTDDVVVEETSVEVEAESVSVVEEPVIGASIVEETIVEEPVAEEPTTDEPMQESVVAEEPLVEKIVQEEPKSITEDVAPQPSESLDPSESFDNQASSEVAVCEEKDTPVEPTIADCQSTESQSQPENKTKKRRGCLKWIFVLLLLMTVAFVLYWFVIPTLTPEPSRKDVTIEQDEIKVRPNLEEELGTGWGNATKTDEKLLEDTESTPVDSVGVKEQQAEVAPDSIAPEFTFYITDSLLAKDLKKITPADTTDYAIEGTLVVHKLKSGETIVQLANKYYGEKRLWPYIVGYNRMERFNSVAIGQEILIPRLKNK